MTNRRATSGRMNAFEECLLASAAGFGVAGTAAGIGAALLARDLWKRARAVPGFAGKSWSSPAARAAWASLWHRSSLGVARGSSSADAIRRFCAKPKAPAGHAAEVLAVPCDVTDQRQDRGADQAGESNIWARRCADQQCRNNRRRAPGVANRRGLRSSDGHDVLGNGVHHAGSDSGDGERGSGRIANITSIGGKVAIPHLVPYACAKFAAVGFSEGIRAELAKDRIKVTTVVPGLMRTGSHANAIFKGDHRKEYGWFSLGGIAPHGGHGSASCSAQDRQCRRPRNVGDHPDPASEFAGAGAWHCAGRDV